MVVRLRLARIGRHDLPFYRIVAADARAPRDGKFLEQLGSFNPMPLPTPAAIVSASAATEKTKEVSLNVSRIKYWLSVGAQPSDTVAKLLALANLIPKPPQRHTLPGATKSKAKE
ncbi:mitochondrial ribosomal protein S16 (bS16m) [Andalucia godoyi]|uniref:Mitochondrial ribosomal protein S16 (BS16m) n=1 Tax=Andalucia godoyi TaxID=505711 RepID=A0A8K0F2H4_ANDGO|nr:mitochondrial ribosomal protein S16 (bS16m) [Andalucia godoyi]|eukprot:ANDGO_00845.mRNA.1 mitochondrial ribosomal protein S16 (bS16m)